MVGGHFFLRKNNVLNEFLLRASNQCKPKGGRENERGTTSIAVCQLGAYCSRYSHSVHTHGGGGNRFDTHKVNHGTEMALVIDHFVHQYHRSCHLFRFWKEA